MAVTLNRVSVITQMAQKQLTTLELSNLATVGLSTVNKARTGKNINANSARRIAQALDVPVESLLVHKEV